MREIKFRAFDHGSGKMLGGDANPIYMDLNGVLMEYSDCEVIEYDTFRNYSLMQYTGLHDKNGKEIYEGDVVSLAGNMTADNSLGWLPNGWIFGEEDVFPVKWGDDLGGWELDMPTKYDGSDPEVTKYLNHARVLLTDGEVEVIGNIYEDKELLEGSDT